MRLLFAAFYSVLLFASTASAQEMTLGQKLNRIKLPLTGLAVAGALDVTSTFTSHANAEGNPTIAWMQPHVGFKNTVVTGAIAEAMLAVFLCARLCEHHPRVAKTLTIGASVAHGYFAGRNWANRDKHLRQLQGWR